MLEREHERAALEGLVADVRRGGGGYIVVEGPLGVGKSALLGELVAYGASARVNILFARATRLGRDVPFGLARRLLEARVRESPSALMSAWARQARPLFDGEQGGLGHAGPLIDGLIALVTELVRLDGPAILAVDDAHWVDPQSLGFLTELADRCTEVRAGLAVAVDIGEASADEPELRRLRRVSGARVLVPAPLTVDAVRELVAEQLPEPDEQLAARVAEASGGNPQLASELLASAERSDLGELELREGIVRVVLSRLDGLGPGTRALAQAVAVLGEAPLRLAAELASIPRSVADAAADELVARQVLVSEGRVRFAQPVVADALLAKVPQFELAAQRHRAAQLLAADGEDDDRVAVHLARSRPAGDTWTCEVLRRAARGALERGDPLAATRLLQRAVDEPPPRTERGNVLVELARAQAAAGLPAAIEGFERALAGVEDPAHRADAWHGLSRLLQIRGDHAQAAASAARGQHELASGDPRRERLLADELASAVLVPELAADAAARIETLIAGDSPSEPSLLALLIVNQAWRGIRVDRIAQLAEMAVAVDPLVEADSRGFALAYVCGALNMIDQTPRASELLSAGLQRVIQLGDPLAEVTLRCTRAWARLYQGQLTLARADLDAVFAMNALEWPAIDGLGGPPLVVLALELGDVRGARDALRRTPAGQHNPGLAWFEGSVALAEGDAATAFEQFQAAGVELEEVFGARNPGVLPWRTGAALAAAQLNQIDTARALADAEIHQAREVGVPRAVGVALRTAGVVSSESRLLEESVDVLERSPARLELARSLMSLGLSYRRARKGVAARPPLGRAFDLARECGATALAARCLAELRASGLRPRLRPRTGVGALTASERTVAELAAQDRRGPPHPRVSQAPGLFPSGARAAVRPRGRPALRPAPQPLAWRHGRGLRSWSPTQALGRARRARAARCDCDRAAAGARARAPRGKRVDPRRAWPDQAPHQRVRKWRTGRRGNGRAV
jgi:tetratricopeptide (TPR) repeat protein